MTYPRNFLREWPMITEAEELWTISVPLMDQINEEKEFLNDLRKRNQDNPMAVTWNKIRERHSKERLSVLINKFAYDGKKIEGLEKARDYPIDKVITFVRDMAKCPWHNDTDPSLHLIRKSNVAYCFSCQQAYDVIDAGQLLWGTSFKETIKKLT